MRIQFKKFSEFAKIPKKATPGSACFDVFSSCEVILRPGETKRISLDIRFKFSEKLCCRIYPRSGLSLIPTFVGGEVIDSDYQGKIDVILTNFGCGDVKINRGDKIAQVMFVKPAPVFFMKFLNFLILLSEELADLVLQKNSFMLFFSKKRCLL